jgi:SAM-dependent methyltransferase
MKLDNPLLVRWEYASEERLAKRNSIFRALIDGVSPEDVAFAADDFDCVFAGWVLYHVPGLEQGIAECARVLRPSSRLVASCHREDNLSELWALIDDGGQPREPLSFSSESGAELLGKSFEEVERQDVEATLVFPTMESMRVFVAEKPR